MEFGQKRIHGRKVGLETSVFSEIQLILDKPFLNMTLYNPHSLPFLISYYQMVKSEAAPAQKACIWFGLDILLSLLSTLSPTSLLFSFNVSEQTGLMNPSAIANLPPLKKKEHSSSRKMLLHN